MNLANAARDEDDRRTRRPGVRLGGAAPVPHGGPRPPGRPPPPLGCRAGHRRRGGVRALPRGSPPSHRRGREGPPAGGAPPAQRGTAARREAAPRQSRCLVALLVPTPTHPRDRRRPSVRCSKTTTRSRSIPAASTIRASGLLEVTSSQSWPGSGRCPPCLSHRTSTRLASARASRPSSGRARLRRADDPLDARRALGQRPWSISIPIMPRSAWSRM